MSTDTNQVVPYQRPKTQEDPPIDVSGLINGASAFKCTDCKKDPFLAIKHSDFIRHCAIRHSETYPHLAHRCPTCPYMNGRCYQVRNHIKLCKGTEIQYKVGDRHDQSNPKKRKNVNEPKSSASKRTKVTLLGETRGVYTLSEVCPDNRM